MAEFNKDKSSALIIASHSALQAKRDRKLSVGLIKLFLRLNSAPLVAVVILNWNGKKFLEQFLPSVLQSTYANTQIIVADNASTDDSLSFLQQFHPTVRVIKLDKNFGFAKGYNEALRQVEADYFMILNSDVEVRKDWLEPMVDLLADESIGACQPKILSYSDKSMFEYAGAAGGWIDKYGYPFSKGRVFEHCEADKGQYDQSEPIFWASGAALFIRASLFRELNGFDDYFFAHQEEIDLCWRLQLMGKNVYSCPASVVYHVGGGTLPRGNSRKTFLNFRNNLVMLAKNLPWSTKWWIIPFRLSLNGIAAVKELLSGDGGYFWAICRAHWAFIGWVLRRKNRAHFPVKRNGSLSGMLKKSVVWLHFIRKKNTFSEIVHETH